jgi:hypothetical protein
MKKKGVKNFDKEDMRTLSSCLNSLAVEGFVTQFKVTPEGLKSLSTDKVYRKEEIDIISFYRFEGESDPADNAILYAIETKSGEKGTLTDAYGMYGDPNISAFIKEIESIQKRAHKHVKI